MSGADPFPPSPLLPEEDAALYAVARQTLTLCAVCKYCDGFCPVFRQRDAVGGALPGAGQAPAFTDADVDWLASLCHGCRACWDACQYAPPHAYAIAVPQTLAAVRRQQQTPLPGLRRRLLAVMLAASGLLPLLMLGLIPPEVLFAVHTGPGAFYAVLPWGWLSGLAGGALLLAMALSLGRMVWFWRHIGVSGRGSGGGPDRLTGADWRAGLRQALTLRHLDHPRRRRAHHALTGGFALCFAATAVATLWHHGFGWIAPYPLLSLPVGLGTVGGLLMLAGCGGLWRENRRSAAAVRTPPGQQGLLILLALVAATGLALLALRGTAAMGLVLGWHLGLVLVLFLALPLGGLAHAPQRLAAVLKAARLDRRRQAAAGSEKSGPEKAGEDG